MTNRRDFVRNTALGLAAIAVSKESKLTFANPYDLPIGLELYTVRRQMEKDPEGTLRKVAATGYQGVEVDAKSLPKFAPILKSTGLTAPSVHLDFGQLKMGWEQAIERVEALGAQYAVVAFINAPDRKTLEDFKKIAQLFNKAGEQCQQAGVQFCYHNHNFEFIKFDGGIGYDVLMGETDPKFVKFELDCFWMTHAGYDPVEYMHKYPGRFSLLHIKDLKKGIPNSTTFATPMGNPFTEVGKGVIDWKRIFVAAREGGLKLYFVEQDETDIPAFEAIKISYDYLHNLTV
jgi:sugar phosphate isomerase/epimerase